MDISIIIVNYNVKQLLDACLETVFRSVLDGDFEVWVIDNASTDNSVRDLKPKYPLVRWLECNENIGFPAANNLGFKSATGDYIFMLNPDTELSENALAELWKSALKHPNVGLFAPKLLNTDRSIQHSAWKFPKLRYLLAESFYLKFLAKNKYYTKCPIKSPLFVDSVSGAAMFFKRDVLEKVGDLDERLFWIEDVDFCKRIVDKGLKVMYLPEVQVVHHVGQSAKKSYIISLSNQIFNKIKYFEIHGPSWKAMVAKWISFVECLYKWLVFSILQFKGEMYAKKAAAYRFTLFKVFSPPYSMDVYKANPGSK